MALKEIVDQFFISIGLDTKQLDQGIDKAITGTRDRLKGLVTNAIAPALAMLTSGALVNQFADEAVQLDRLSTSLGVNIEQLQAWQGAAEQAGVAGEEVGELFADLNDWMLDADQNQSGAMYEYIEKGLLPAVRNARGEMKSTEQYALEMADAFQAMGTQMATGLGRQIGISQAAMVGFLQQGSAKISADMQRIKEMGVYTKQDAEAARDFQKSVDALERSLKSLLLPIFRLLLPIVTTVADGLNYLTKHTWAFVPAIAGLGAMMVMSLLPSMKKVYEYMRLMRLEMLKFLFNPWTWIIAGLIALGLLLEDFIVWLNGGQSAFGKYYQSMADWLKGAKQWFDEVAKKISDWITGVEQWQARTREMILGWRKAFADGLAGIVDSVAAFPDQVLTIFVGLEKTVQSLFAGLYGWLNEATGGALDQIAAILTNSLNVWADYFGIVKAGISLLLDVIWALVSGSDEAWAAVEASLDNLKSIFAQTFEDIKATLSAWWDFASGIFDKVRDFFKLGGKLQTFFGSGAAAQAVPASAGNIDSSNRNTSLDSQTTVNIYGSATREEYAQAEATANGINSSNIAQAVASQAGI